MSEVEDFALRAKPQPVTRLSKRAIIITTTIVVMIVVMAFMVTINPPSARGESTSTELYNVSNKPVSDRLADLPSNYGEHANMMARQVQVSAAVTQDTGEPVETTEQPSAKTQPNHGLTRRRYGVTSRRGDANQSALFFSSSNSQGKTIDAERLIAEALGEKGTSHGTSASSIKAGTLIPASLLTGINSDLPGPAIAQVTQNVYDSATGDHVLIPQGARIIGAYDSGIDFGQRRVFITWSRIINPDGTSIDLANLAAADLSGYAGLTDRIDNHTGELVRAGILSTVLGVGAELAIGDDEDDIARALREGLQGTTNDAGQQLIRRQLNIKPTLTVRPGWAFQIIVTQDLNLAPYRGPSK